MLAVPRVPTDLRAGFGEVAVSAFVAGMDWALFMGAGIVLIGVLVAWRLFPLKVEQVEE